VPNVKVSVWPAKTARDRDAANPAVRPASPWIGELIEEQSARVPQLLRGHDAGATQQYVVS
jgi:hypothetical protein